MIVAPVWDEYGYLICNWFRFDLQEGYDSGVHVAVFKTLGAFGEPI
jgi:hypothetical protein